MTSLMAKEEIDTPPTNSSDFQPHIMPRLIKDPVHDYSTTSAASRYRCLLTDHFGRISTHKQHRQLIRGYVRLV
jgi:hypothetical protein